MGNRATVNDERVSANVTVYLVWEENSRNYIKSRFHDWLIGSIKYQNSIIPRIISWNHEKCRCTRIGQNIDQDSFTFIDLCKEEEILKVNTDNKLSLSINIRHL